MNRIVTQIARGDGCRFRLSIAQLVAESVRSRLERRWCWLIAVKTHIAALAPSNLSQWDNLLALGPWTTAADDRANQLQHTIGTVNIHSSSEGECSHVGWYADFEKALRVVAGEWRRGAPVDVAIEKLHLAILERDKQLIGSAVLAYIGTAELETDVLRGWLVRTKVFTGHGCRALNTISLTDFSKLASLNTIAVNWSGTTVERCAEDLKFASLVSKIQ